MKTPLTLLTTLLATLVALCLPQTAYALECATPDASHLYEKSAWVAKATVLKVNGIERIENGFGGQAVNVLVKIDRLYKGQPRPNNHETNFNREQRVVFGHVPHIGHAYTLFVQEDFALGSIDKALKWIGPDWGRPAQIAGKSCYRGDFLMDASAQHEQLSSIYTFIANLDKPSQGGSVLIEVYAPSALQATHQAMREVKFYLQPISPAASSGAAALIALAQSPKGRFSAANVPAGHYQLVVGLPNPKLGFDRTWFYSEDAPLAEKIFYRLARRENASDGAKKGDKSLCILAPSVTLTLNDRGSITRRFRLDTVPNESLEVAPTPMKEGACQ